MKKTTSALVLTAMLGAGTFLSTPAMAANDIIAQESASVALTGDRMHAAQFVHALSQARYSLSIEDKASATKFINEAKELAEGLAAKTGPITGIRSGRIGYGDNESYYYPAEANMITKKKVALGPFWASDAKKALAVKDAEFIYLTVDLKDADVQEDLNEALKELANNKFGDADDEVEDVLDDVASIDSKEAAPAVKASDNLELANYYMAAKNYDAARYPLKHAKNALEDMKDDDRYAAQRAKVDLYLNQIDKTEAVIEKNDPTAMEKLKKDVSAWWGDVKTWADEKTSS